MRNAPRDAPCNARHVRVTQGTMRGPCYARPALEAKVSGSEVPRATKVMAVTELLRPIVQPTCAARSPMNAVRMPMMTRVTPKQTQPWASRGGGMPAQMVFHGRASK